RASTKKAIADFKFSTGISREGLVSMMVSMTMWPASEAGIFAPVDQQILAGNESGVVARQEGAIRPDFFGSPDPSRRDRSCEPIHHLLVADTGVVRQRMGITLQAIGRDLSRQEIVDRHAVAGNFACQTGGVAGEA